MATIGTINIVLTATTGQFDSALKKAVAQTKALGRDLEDFGKTATAAITIPFAAAATAATASALKIDDALDSVRARTGATGEAFETLSNDVRSVFGTVPDSIETVADAISGLAQRLGLSGKPLQDMATQMLNLARLTGSEVGPVIESTTRLFSSFGIEAEKQAGSLDFLYKASQQSGIGFTKLTELVNQFGPSLRSLGFSFEEAVGMIASFEKSGVNTEKVMTAFNGAMKNFAKEGIKDVAGALEGTIERIRSAGTTSEGAAIAMKAFGAKAGPELAEAIRSGRLEIGAFIDKVRESPETINGAAEATRGFAERALELKNQVMLAVEPLGVSLLKAFESLMPAIQGVVGWLKSAADWFAHLSPAAQQTIIVLGGIAAAIGPVAIAAGSMIKGFAGIASALSGAGGLVGLMSAALPILAALAAAFVAVKVGTFIYDLMTAQDRMKEFAKGVNDLASDIKSKFGVVIQREAGESLEAWEKRLIEANHQLNEFKGSVDKIPETFRNAKVSIDTTKSGLEQYTVSMGKTATGTKDLATGTGLMTDEQKKAAKEIENLKKKFEEASTPMNKMAVEFGKLEKAGVSFNDILKAHQAEIVKATLEQLSHGKALTDTAAKYGEAAVKIENAKLSVSAFDTVMAGFAARAQKDLADTAKAMEDASEKIMQNLDSVEDALNFGLVGALKSSSGHLQDFWDKMANYYKLDPNLFKKTVIDPITEGTQEMTEKSTKNFKDMGDVWLQSVSTMVTDLAKSITDILFHWGGLFDAMKNIGLEFAQSFVRGIVENLLKPFKEQMDKLAGIISGALSALGPVWGGVVAAAVAATAAIANAWTKLPDALQNTIKILVPNVAIISAAIKTVGEKMSKDAMRDMGLDISAKQFEAFAKSLGVAAKAFEDVRKDVMFSPKFLTEIAYPLAEAQGKLEQFMKSLEHIGTAWGTFNFRDAFQIGLLTGDFTQLNEAFIEAFGSSEQLKAALPEWETLLAAVGHEADDAYKALKQMFDQFEAGGPLTEEFSARILELGGNLEIFQAAAELPGLKAALGQFTELKQMVDELLPKQKSANELFLETGEITAEMARNIELAGGNLEAFQKFAEVKAARDSLDGLVAKFKETGVVSEELTRIIQTFGSEGVRSMEITADSIDHVAEIMEWDLGGAMRNAAHTLSLELEKMNRTLEEQIGFLTKAIIRSFDAMVYAMAGMPEKAREMMDALNAEFEAWKPKVEVEVAVDEVILGETVDRIENAISPILIAEVQVTADTSAVTQALAATQRQITQIQQAAAVPPPNPFDAAINRSGSLPARSVIDNPFAIDPRFSAYGGSVGFKTMKGYYEAMGWAWEAPEEFQHGGLVGRTGPAILHAGERVIPAGQGAPITVNLSPYIKVNVEGSENTGQDVAQELARLLPGILERNARGFAAKLKRELGLPNYGGAV